MTTQVDEADRLIALAKEKSVRIVASPGQMLFPHNQRIRRRILEGALGRLSWALTGTSAGSGTYHLNEEFRTGNDILSTVDPSWYFRKPGGGPQYDVTVYCLHNLTGILGPARRVTAMSGIALPQREYRGRMLPCDMDDNTFLMLDFGDTVVGFVFASVAGSIGSGFQPNIYGTKGSIIGTCLGKEDLKRPDEFPPHVTGEHTKLREYHVFEDMMQLVDWIRDGTPSIASAEHARHVIDIIESGYRAAETGRTQVLRTTFDPLPLG
jgi:predicted dehydrogenase